MITLLQDYFDWIARVENGLWYGLDSIATNMHLWCYGINESLMFQRMITNYTLDDLAAAEAELQRWNDAYANDSSNNPNKFEAQRRDARRLVRRVSDALKDRGLIEKSDSERLTEELDRQYPDAPSRKVVTYNGVKYQIRYFPLEKSRSRKTVKEWGHRWEEV
ncbi:hypothetical protein JAO85_20690 [Comamonas sp. NyZ500]|uniref:hypothetical protein n=1 Tax=Comamonas sp. NyZ500 TaxID=2795732 RepID=UPI00192ABE21|nr:hypothetical protein [Comamonas sp. NyZ500]MBL5979700.1 hypothetical protein [Comamonas sp. NyZ500]